MGNQARQSRELELWQVVSPSGNQNRQRRAVNTFPALKPMGRPWMFTLPARKNNGTVDKQFNSKQLGGLKRK